MLSLQSCFLTSLFPPEFLPLLNCKHWAFFNCFSQSCRVSWINTRNLKVSKMVVDRQVQTCHSMVWANSPLNARLYIYFFILAMQKEYECPTSICSAQQVPGTKLYPFQTFPSLYHADGFNVEEERGGGCFEAALSVVCKKRLQTQHEISPVLQMETCKNWFSISHCLFELFSWLPSLPRQKHTMKSCGSSSIHLAVDQI